MKIIVLLFPIVFSFVRGGCLDYTIGDPSTLFNIWSSPSFFTSDRIYGVDLMWACGSDGRILRSTNGGDSWPSQQSGTNVDLTGGCALPPSASDTTVWVVGDSGTILRTNNGGLNWFPQNSGTMINLNSVCCVPPTSTDTILWAVGDSGTILKTTNGGANWFPQNSGVMENLNDIQCFDADTAIAVGEFFTGLKTTNGGTSWEVVGIGLQAPRVRLRSTLCSS